jgi:hypothetical protein
MLTELLRAARALAERRDVGATIHLDQIGRRVWRQLVERYPNVPFPITLPPCV